MIQLNSEELKGKHGMTFRTLEVAGLVPAFHAMRNPKDSWNQSDSKITDLPGNLLIGENDMKLAQSLISGGPCHSKFLRDIIVWVDITGPLYFWTELDTYKVGTVRNSCSTMHKLTSKVKAVDGDELTDSKIYELFCVDDDPLVLDHIRTTWTLMHDYYVHSMDEENVKLRKLKQLLPDSYRMQATYMCSYATIRNINKWRATHRLPEWSVDWMEWVKTLPYAEHLIFYRSDVG